VNEFEWKLLEEHEPVNEFTINGVNLRTGDRVWLRPRGGCDIFDFALNGKVATIESIERDYEHNLHLAVVIDDDSCGDLGVMPRPGHRFFFAPYEVEPFLPIEISGTEH